MKKNNNKIGLLFITPSLIGQIVFFMIPFFIIIYYSILDNPMNKKIVGMSNYINILKNPIFQRAIGNTLIFMCASVFLIITISTLLATQLNKNIFFRKMIRSCFIVPLIVPSASILIIWQTFFDFNGTLNGIIAIFGLNPIDWMNSEYSRIVVILFYLWKNIGYIMILVLAALQNIPNELYEAAQIDGANRWQAFWNITFVNLLPTLFFSLVISIVNSFKIFREIYLLAGDYPYKDLYMIQHYINNLFNVMDYQKLSVSSIYMAMFILIIVVVWIKIQKKIEE